MPIYIPFSPQYKYLESSQLLSYFAYDPSVDNFHKFAIPTIMVMQPLYGAALI